MSIIDKYLSYQLSAKITDRYQLEALFISKKIDFTEIAQVMGTETQIIWGFKDRISKDAAETMINRFNQCKKL